MKPQTKKFETKYLRRRNAIERKGIRLVKSALREQYAAFLAKAEELPMQMWPGAITAVNERPIKHFFETYYPMSADLAMMTLKNMVGQKSAEEDIWMSIFQRKMQNLVSGKEYAERIVTITNTTRERINKTLQDILTEGELNGYGISTLRTNLKDAIGKNFRGNAMARAKVIAQTEMISASNQASTYAADATGLEYRKFWSTSHLQGIRPSHMDAEQDSIAKGGLKKDERFSNGLLYPGDPAGSAEEIINCRCTVLHEIV